MKIDKLIASIILVTIIGLGGVFLLGNDSSSQSTQENTAKVLVSNKFYDWGEIPIDGGTVSASFPIKNDGEGPLTLSNIVTSCMCTTAKLILGETISPEFGMHTKSSYVLEIPPGQTATLEVVFDPAFHGPNGVGPITRQIKVQTNDTTQKTINFMLTATVKSS